VGKVAGGSWVRRWQCVDNAATLCSRWRNATFVWIQVLSYFWPEFHARCIASPVCAVYTPLTATECCQTAVSDAGHSPVVFAAHRRRADTCQALCTPLVFATHPWRADAAIVFNVSDQDFR